MQPIDTDRVAWSVCRSVTLVSPAKTTQPIEMPFGLWTRMGPRNHGGAYWRHLAYTIEPSVCGADVAFLSNYHSCNYITYWRLILLSTDRAQCFLLLHHQLQFTDRHMVLISSAEAINKFLKYFWANVTSNGSPMLRDRPLSVLPVCKVGVLWPNCWKDQESRCHSIWCGLPATTKQQMGIPNLESQIHKTITLPAETRKIQQLPADLLFRPGVLKLFHVTEPQIMSQLVLDGDPLSPRNQSAIHARYS